MKYEDLVSGPEPETPIRRRPGRPKKVRPSTVTVENPPPKPPAPELPEIGDWVWFHGLAGYSAGKSLIVSAPAIVTGVSEYGRLHVTSFPVGPPVPHRNVSHASTPRVDSWTYQREGDS